MGDSEGQGCLAMGLQRVEHRLATEQQGAHKENLELRLLGMATRLQDFLMPNCGYPGNESFKRVFIQDCNLMWNVPEQTPKNLYVLP